MRFGLSDVDELPSLKEFEQLARAALGTDEGIAPIEPELEAAAARVSESSPPVAEGAPLDPGVVVDETPQSPEAPAPEPGQARAAAVGAEPVAPENST